MSKPPSFYQSVAAAHPDVIRAYEALGEASRAARPARCGQCRAHQAGVRRGRAHRDRRARPHPARARRGRHARTIAARRDPRDHHHRIPRRDERARHDRGRDRQARRGRRVSDTESVAAVGAAPSRRAFPKSFLWGAATSAHQVEGGNPANDWWRFEQEPGVLRTAPERRRVPPLRALRCATSRSPPPTGTTPTACRSSGAASSPSAAASTPRGRALPRGARVAAAARARAVVTLLHFTSPLWIADAGGWESRRHHRPLRRLRALLRARVRRRGGLVVHHQRARGVRVPRLVEGMWPPAERDDGARSR